MKLTICWYCGSGIWVGDLVTQPDGNLLHKRCQAKTERDYPNRLPHDAEQTDAKVSWLDQQDCENDAGAFWA